MSMSIKKCCVPGCMESGGSHRNLHLFPNPAKDRERFNQWVYAIGGDILGLDNEYIYKHRSVCHAHFEEKFCCRNNKLSNIAVPTLNLPGPLSLPKFTFAERRPLRPIENISSPPIASTPALPPTASSPSLVTPSTSFLPAENPIYFSSVIEVGNIEIKTSTKEIRGCIKSTPTKVAKKHARVSLEEQNLYRKLVQARVKLSKYKYKINKQSANIKAAKNIVTNPALLATLEKFPSAAKVLTLMQFREMKKKNKGQRFTMQEKILALSIFKQAPKGYRFLRKIFVLPAPQTLAKLISLANIEPGINKKMFSQLKTVAEKMKPQERLCVLLFDEMFLKANINYNERKDKVIGLVTDGKTTKSDFADHAQVYMIRGLIKNYKQAVAYTFSAAATSGQQIVKEIKEIIRELKSIGLIVVSTVCDQGANNRKALKILLQESRGTYIKNGQEPNNNIILIDGQEVVPLYDPPHLIKCVRNNLISKDLEYVYDGKKCKAKWQHLTSLYKENPGYKGVRLIPKLTENHVLPDKVAKNKMKVKFATQIFSRTVATNMGYLADKGILPKESSETADILLFFDNLFDSFNGSYNKKKEKYSKPLLGPVTPKSAHQEHWAEAKKKLKSMTFVHPITGKPENVPTLNNWAWTVDGVQVLLNKLHKEYNVTSVWMRHLNQDPIENFFGAIRSHGCRNTNPTPERFESAFTTLLINNMSTVHAPVGTNCERDFCESLHALIVADDCKATGTCNLELIPNITITDIETKRNDPRIMAPLQYVSGYFIKKSKKNVFKSCKTCNKNVIASEGTEYIKYREYAGRRWLCSPTETIINCISAIQDITNVIIKECLEKSNIKEFLKTIILIFVDFDFLDCSEHKDGLINYLINLTSRFFLYNYCKDLNLIISGKRDCNDDEDKFQIKAKKYYKKCRKRPIKQ